MSKHLNFQAGNEYIIRSLGQDKKIARRLAQMGILPGSIVRIVRVAPFGETLEVSIDQGQYVALRDEEINALDFEILSMRLTAKTVKTNQDYRVKTLFGGKTFQQKMKQQGIHPGTVVQIHALNEHLFQILLLAHGNKVLLGQGEAEKIIIEEIDGGQT